MKDIKISPVVHFEMPASDTERMVKFYTKAFGWKTEQLGPEMGNYILVTTTESDDKGLPKEKGQINGGFFKNPTNDGVTHYPSVVIAVENILDSIEMVKDAGGQIMDEPMEIPGVGTFVAFVDTEGNRLSMLESIPM